MENNYVSVGNIIEQERLRRQAQISKGIDSNVYDQIEKAHQDDLSDDFEKSDNLVRFENDIQDLNKAETEFLLNKIQRQLNADSESSLLKAMKSIAINHIGDIEKANYVDNSKNRKLGRVGQEYGGKKSDESDKSGKMSLDDIVSKFLTAREDADYNEALVQNSPEDARELEKIAMQRYKKSLRKNKK